MSRMAARGRFYPPTGYYGRVSVIVTSSGSLAKTLATLTIDADGTAGTTPSWNVASLTADFVNGTGSSTDLSPYLSNWDSVNYELRVTTGTLQSGVTLDSTNTEVDYDGAGAVSSSTTTVSIVQRDNWATRAADAGVVMADRLEDTLTVNTNTAYPSVNSVWRSSASSLMTRDTSIKVNGATGSQRITVLNTTTDPAIGLRCYHGATNAFDDGDTFWISFRMYHDRVHAYADWKNDGGSFTGAKFALFADWNESHTSNEIVPGDSGGENDPGGYFDGGAFDRSEQGESNSCSASDFRFQPNIDRSVITPPEYAPTYPLTGTNPDTGAAWTTCERYAAQHGTLYSVSGNPWNPRYRNGYGDPFSGLVRYPANEWFTYTSRYVRGTNGANSQWTLWIARDGQPYELIKHVADADNSDGPTYNTVWLSTYTTARIAGGRKVSTRTNNITGVEIWNVGHSTPVGDGTLSYNASTGRLTWQARGSAVGATRGYSTANRIFIRNVESGDPSVWQANTNYSLLDVVSPSVANYRMYEVVSDSGSSGSTQPVWPTTIGATVVDGGITWVCTRAFNNFILVKFTPSLLPSTNQADTVTIADGRPDTFACYNDLIVSTQQIMSPNGDYPVVP